MSVQKEHQNRKMGKKGIDAYKKEKNIHDACDVGDLEAVKELVADSPSNIWKTDEVTYFSALHYAAQGGHVEVAKYLLSQGADINRKSKSGETALHLACMRGHLEMVKLLLVKGSDLTLTNFHKQGTYTVRQTALEVAEEHHFQEIVKTFEKFKSWDAKRRKQEGLLKELKEKQEKELSTLRETTPDGQREEKEQELLSKHQTQLNAFYEINTTVKPTPAPIPTTDQPEIKKED